MNLRMTQAVVGCVVGVVLSLLATQIALVTFGVGSGLAALGMLGTILLISLAVLAGRRWPIAAYWAGAAGLAVVILGLVVGDGSTGDALLMSPATLVFFAAGTPLTITPSAAAVAGALSARAHGHRGEKLSTETPATPSVR